ncbi:MAG: BON domain-containing protein [Rickettsiales bacterium]|nr:BON domain-containing protein [Rickettsiales bacterium]
MGRRKLLVLKFICCVIALQMLSSCIPLLIGGGGAAILAGGKLVKQEKTVGESLNDTTIWSKIRANLSRRGIDNVMLGSINVKVSEGRVLLTGTISNKHKVIPILQACWSVHGVKEVINELQIADKKEKTSVLGGISDAWITTKIKAKLLAARDIPSVNYTVETIDKVVYLFGIGKFQEELNRVIDVVSSIKQVKKIVSYVRVKKDVRKKITHTKGNREFLSKYNDEVDEYESDKIDKPTIIKPNTIPRDNNVEEDDIFEDDDF